MFNIYRPQRSCGQGNIFTPVCHSVHRGGVLPQCMLGYHPPWDQADPPGSDPPGTRQTPLDQTPPPETRQTPPDQTPPQDQADPLPPREADSSIRSTSGRYASYWNAFLCVRNSVFIGSYILGFVHTNQSEQ